MSLLLTSCSASCIMLRTLSSPTNSCGQSCDRGISQARLNASTHSQRAGCQDFQARAPTPRTVQLLATMTVPGRVRALVTALLVPASDELRRILKPCNKVHMRNMA